VQSTKLTGRESAMPVYVLLSTLTPRGRETLRSNPERVYAVNEEVERFGCKVFKQYALLGSYDFLTIVEAPDNETVAQLSIELGSRGTVSIAAVPAIEIDALELRLESVRRLDARPVMGQETDQSTS
jgi:uncharacterized protein with GYD domain